MPCTPHTFSQMCACSLEDARHIWTHQCHASSDISPAQIHAGGPPGQVHQAAGRTRHCPRTQLRGGHHSAQLHPRAETGRPRDSSGDHPTTLQPRGGTQGSGSCPTLLQQPFVLLCDFFPSSLHQISNYYGVSGFQTTEHFLTAVAQRLGKKKKGGIYSQEEAAKAVLADWVR